MRVLLVGEESAGVQVLRMLTTSDHDIVAVLAQRDGSADRPATVRGVTVGAQADRLGHPVWRPELVTDPAFADRVRDEQIDLVLNIHSLHIMDAAVAASPRIGAFNLHPGPLPAYAGLNAPSWAVLHGEDSHGVTLHWMDAGLDTGAIAYQARFGVTATDTGLSVAARCVREGLALVSTLLETATRSPADIPRIAQDRRRRSYFGRDVPHGGVVDWHWPAREIDAFVRASDYHPLPSPWGTPTTLLDGAVVKVARTALTGAPTDAPPGTVGSAAGSGVHVACADEWLAVTHVAAAGRRAPAGALLHPGQRLVGGLAAAMAGGRDLHADRASVTGA